MAAKVTLLGVGILGSNHDDAFYFFFSSLCSSLCCGLSDCECETKCERTVKKCKSRLGTL